MITRTLSFLLICVVLTACSLFDPDANLKSERQLWEEAQGHMDGIICMLLLLLGTDWRCFTANVVLVGSINSHDTTTRYSYPHIYLQFIKNKPN